MFKQKFILRYGRTVVYFGIDVVKELNDIIGNSKRIYVVTSKNAARISGALNDVRSVLDMHGVSYEVFDGVRANPMYTVMEEIAENIKRFEPDYVIAIGGGSVIDSAKVASAIAVCGGSVKDYILGSKRVAGSKPVIAINLTHGTGSEVNRYAVVTIDNPKTKIGIASEHLYPIASFNDPRYTLSMPQNQIVYTTLDAFYHAYEAATGRDSSPYVLLIAEEVVKIISNWLPMAIRDLNNLEARYWLLYASMLAGIAIDNSRAHLVHAMENVLSGINTELSHGAGLAMLGPYAIEYIHKAVPENSYKILRHLDPSIRPAEEDAEKAREAVAKFQKLVGFEEKLSDYGFTSNDADTIVDTIFNMLSYSLRLVPFNASKEMIKAIYLRALQ